MATRSEPALASLDTALEKQKRHTTIWMLIAIAALVVGAAVTLWPLLVGEQDDQEHTQAMSAVEAGAPRDVELVGSIAYSVEDGNDNRVAFVVNAIRRDQEVLCRAIVATEEVECVDLPVRWLYFDDGLGN